MKVILYTASTETYVAWCTKEWEFLRYGIDVTIGSHLFSQPYVEHCCFWYYMVKCRLVSVDNSSVSFFLHGRLLSRLLGGQSKLVHSTSRLTEQRFLSTTG